MNKCKTQFVEMDRWWVVVLFAVAMAWVESAAVLYLRTLIGRIDPYQPNPLPSFGGFAMAEVIREAATMVMLAGAGWLAGARLARAVRLLRHRVRRVGHLLLCFPASADWLAEGVAGLGRVVPDTAAVVGTGGGTMSRGRADDSVRGRW